jgi:uncharacterized protein
MTVPPLDVGPTQVEVRIASLDIARGIALCGILLMNITMFGLPFAYGDPSVAGGSTGPDLWAWITTSMLFEGTQRGLFSILFGAGLIIMTASLDRSTRPHAPDFFFRRNLWLVVFGVIHGFLILWTGEILFYYGATALFVYGFRNATPRTMLNVAIGGLIFNAAWNGLDTYNALAKHRAYVVADSAKTAGDSLSPKQTAAIEAWQGVVKDFKPDTAKINKEIRVKQGGYAGIVVLQAPRLTHFQSWWLYRGFFDIFSMMLIGMALFKLGVFGAEYATKRYWTMVIVGYGIGLTTNYLEVTELIRSEFSVLAFFETGITYDLGRLAMTMGHLGLIMLFCRATGFRGLKTSLAAIGRTAFSNYILTSVICAFVFYGFGLGLYAQLRRHELYYVVGAIWLFQLIASPLWLSRFRFGPLEYVWRWLTYGERPRMQGAAGATE